MTEDRTVYLDYASTAAIRPPAVKDAIVDFLDNNGATPGRASHRLAVEADRIALRCRQALAAFLDIPGDAGRIAFFPNATFGINAAINGIAQQGDRIVVTEYDHNAVLRPAYAMAATRGAEAVMVGGDRDGGLDRDAFARAVCGAKLVVLNAVSNVLGTALDVAALTKIAHDAGAIVLVDAAQAAGEVPFSVSNSGADAVALTGHKALLGPPGIGALWVRAGLDVHPSILGGTGGDSMSRDMPAEYPDHLEAGSQNGAAIAGLAAGIDWLSSRHEEVRTTALQHARELRSGLADMAGITVHSPMHAVAPIIAITSDVIDPASLAMRLDREHGVLVRAGHHCAPEVHRVIGTADTGAVRFSTGWATTAQDVTHALRAVEACTRKTVVASGGIPA